MNLKAVLFDLDGVLIDSEGIYTDFWSDIDRRYPTGVDDFAHVIKGTTLPDILSTYFPDPQVQADVRALLATQEREMSYRPFPGAIDLLQDLHNAGISTAIVTSSNRMKMRRLFSQIPELQTLTDTIVTDEDVTRSKPDPEGYLLAASRLEAPVGSYAVVEDSLAGLRAARAAHALVVGLTTTNPREDVEPLADITLPQIASLADILLQI